MRKKALFEFGRLSALPAAMIEETYLSEPTSTIGKVFKAVKIRAYYLGVFLPAVSIDLVSSLLGGVRYGAGVFLRTDDVQQTRLKKFEKYGTLFSKNVIALATSPFGLIDPKLVELHFSIAKPIDGVVSGGGGYYRAPEVMVLYPESNEAVQNAVTYAVQNNCKIMPMGAGLSQGKQFLPEGKGREKGVVVDLSRMNTIEIEPDEKIATVGAGAIWSEVQTRADQYGLALQVMQASNVFSGGGSIGTNIHGWNHRMGVLSNTLVSLTIINANAEKQTLTPADPLFHHVTGGLGLFGIVTSFKIKLTKNEWLQEVGKAVALGDYVKHFNEKVLPDETIRMHLYRLSLDPKDLLGAGVAVDYVVVGQQTKTPELSQESAYGTRQNQVMANVARRVSFFRNAYWEREKARLVKNNSMPMTTNAVMQPVIKALFHDAPSEAEWLQEYFVAGEKLQTFLHALGRILMENKVVLLNASVRFVKQHDKSPLSYARDGDRFAVVLCFTQSLQHGAIVKASKWLRQAQRLAVDAGGTYYLPYQHLSDPQDFMRAYSGADEAMKMKKKVDPNQIFVSGFYQKYLSAIMNPEPIKPNYFRALTCNNEMKARFAGFLQVVLQRVEAKQLFILLDDIMRYKDSHAEIYAELCLRLREISPSALLDFKHIVESLSAIKADLAEQAAVLLDDVKIIDGLVEVGYPGRFIEGFKTNFKVTGKVVAVYEAPSLSDYIQTASITRPYDQFARLDYSDPDLHTLPDNSADVITCYVGLHHFTQDKVGFFLQEIRRVLRPGGHFLLVDHDVRNADDMAMAHGAHMIFNAVAGVSLQAELSEVRLFASMEHWKKLLKKAGLGYAVSCPDPDHEVEMIRPGDPSRNRMVHFIEPTVEIRLSSAVGTLFDERRRQKRAEPASPSVLDNALQPRVPQ